MRFVLASAAGLVVGTQPSKSDDFFLPIREGGELAHVDALREDADLIARLKSAPNSYTYHVDVSRIPSERVEAYLCAAKRSFKGRMKNGSAGHLDLYFRD